MPIGFVKLEASLNTVDFSQDGYGNTLLTNSFPDYVTP